MDKNTDISILIAEDDEHIALAIEAIVKKAFDCKLISVAEDGEFAWRLLEKYTYDLVISDWNMPGLTGQELLGKIRESSAHKTTPFLMLTARADKDSVLTAIQSGANDYISKPYEKEQLITKINKLLKLSNEREEKIDALVSKHDSPEEIGDIIKYILERFKDGKVELPVLPHVYTAVNEAIDKEDFSLDSIVRLIQTEPAISAPLITISNSSFYKGRAENKTLEQAITRIGLNATRQYIFMIEGRYLFKTENKEFSELMHKLWMHSISTAICARRISEYLKKGDMEVLFSMGLLHDIGKLPLVNILIELSEKDQHIEQEQVSNVLNQLHTEIGAIMLAQWHFPDEIINIVKHHHSLENKAMRTVELFMVHLANHMVRVLGFSLKSGENIDLEKLESAQLLKLNKQDIEQIIKTANEDIEDIQKQI